jgi:very-short-patch-repair endonuclease
MVAVARDFRKVPTRGEALLWSALRGQQLDGVKFRRQQPIGPFVVDFFAPARRLVVEVDGRIHETQQELDQQRQELLESLGLRFLRIPTEEVERELQCAVAKVRKAVASTAPLSPCGRGAGGEG